MELFDFNTTVFNQILVIKVKNGCRILSLRLGSKWERRISGVNFINVLQAALTHEDPESAKKLLDLSVFLALMGSATASVKAACRTLMKLNPGYLL